MVDVDKASGAWDDCERCVRSFSSVMAANLTFFQTIIAGDSWGKVAIPVTEAYPLAAVIFIGSLFSVVVGIMNLIVAVLVDTAAEAREQEIIHAEKTEKKKLQRLFDKIDLDGSGDLTLDEVEESQGIVPEFQTLLRVLDIQGDDLRELFTMCDEDGSGEIDEEEFINAIYRMKCGEGKTASIFTKHYVMYLKRMLDNVVEKTDHLEGLVCQGFGITPARKGSEDEEDEDEGDAGPPAPNGVSKDHDK